MLQSLFIPNQFSSDTSSHLHLSLSCSYKLHFLCIPGLPTSSLIFHQENDSIWEHATMEPYAMHARKSRTEKKKIRLCYIYQSKCIHLSVCLPHCNGGNRRQELMFSSAISVWLHGILHKILHFITHRAADRHFDFTPTCYKIRTESIQTIKKKEFLYLASLGGNALNEGVGAF